MAGRPRYICGAPLWAQTTLQLRDLDGDSRESATVCTEKAALEKDELQKAAIAYVRSRMEQGSEDTESEIDSDEDYFDEEEKNMIREAERKLKAAKEKEQKEQNEIKIMQNKTKVRMLNMAEEMKEQREMMAMEGERKDANRAVWRELEKVQMKGNDDKRQSLLRLEKNFDSNSDTDLDSEESSFHDQKTYMTDMILQKLEEMDNRKKEGVGVGKITEDENEEVVASDHVIKEKSLALIKDLKEKPHALIKDLKEKPHALIKHLKEKTHGEERFKFTPVDEKKIQREEHERREKDREIKKAREKEELLKTLKKEKEIMKKQMKKKRRIERMTKK
ncbi:trichohyalin-like [Engraulis encrasicolus]|uniref:trichohyalin-like n=1 Tax=Engraulis encrasicolus TaxID=184585 RepID=UPI002FD2A2AC